MKIPHGGMEDKKVSSCENCNRKKIRSDEEKRALVSRVNRIAGQINGIGKMIEDDRYCADVLIQLSAVDKAVKSLAAVLLEGHMHSCLVEDIRAGKEDAVGEIVELFKRFS